MPAAWPPLVPQPRQFSFSSYFTKDRSPSKSEQLKGVSVWVPDEAECYALGTISEVKDDGTVIATTKDGTPVPIPVR